MSTTLIAGCGYVGTALASLLARDGHRVYGLRRDPSQLPRDVEGIAGDVTRPETLDAVPRPVDALVYAVSAGASTEEAYRGAYVTGVRNLLAAAGAGEADGPRRVIYVSSTAVYGEEEGGWVDEESPTDPPGFRGRVLLEGELAVREAYAGSVVVRFGGIYGPGRTRLIERVRSGDARCPPDPPRWTNRIHRDDCAGALAHLLARDDPAPLYLGVDREPAARCELLRWIARALDVPEPPRAAGEPSRSGRRRTNKRCSSERLVASGYRFRYPTFREGYGSLI